MDRLQFLPVHRELVQVPLNDLDQALRFLFLSSHLVAERLAKASGLVELRCGLRLYTFELRQRFLYAGRPLGSFVQLLELDLHLPDHLMYAS